MNKMQKISLDHVAGLLKQKSEYVLITVRDDIPEFYSVNDKKTLISLLKETVQPYRGYCATEFRCVERDENYVMYDITCEQRQTNMFIYGSDFSGIEEEIQKFLEV